MATGYLIIDLEKISLTNKQSVIHSEPDEPGVYERIEYESAASSL